MHKIFLYLMSVFYVAAGVNHFVNPAWYIRIIPAWLPNPPLLNHISGACEIIFGLLLIPETTRSIAAWLIIVLLIAIFPANIQMSIQFYNKQHPYLWLTIARLPLQFALMWWAWQYTKTLP
jgi:uncharacterized membrane protein